MKSTPPKQIVITGGSGYLGRKATKSLTDAGHIVLGLDFTGANVNIDLRSRGDVRLLDLPREYDLIHLASPLPGAFKRNEMIKTFNLINENIGHFFRPNRVLLISSTAVYGTEPVDGYPIVDPWEVYGQCKLDSENFFFNTFENVRVVRPGTMMDKSRPGAIMKLFDRAVDGRILPLPLGGNAHHPFVSVNNVVEFILEWSHSTEKSHEVYDLVASNPLTVSQICNQIAETARIWEMPKPVAGYLGWDRLPIAGVSKWHLKALTYDLPRFQFLPSNFQRTHMIEIFKSIYVIP